MCEGKTGHGLLGDVRTMTHRWSRLLYSSANRLTSLVTIGERHQNEHASALHTTVPISATHGMQDDGSMCCRMRSGNKSALA